MARKGVSFAMQVLIVVIVIMIVALVVLSIFGGGFGPIGQTIQQLIGGTAGGVSCESLEGGSCQSGTACVDGVMSFAGSCPYGQICCVAKPQT